MSSAASFITKAFRTAESILEQVDESIAQTTRRVIVEGATGDFDDDEYDDDEYHDEEVVATADEAHPGSIVEAAAPRRRGLANIRPSSEAATRDEGQDGDAEAEAEAEAEGEGWGEFEFPADSDREESAGGGDGVERDLGPRTSAQISDVPARAVPSFASVADESCSPRNASMTPPSVTGFTGDEAGDKEPVEGSNTGKVNARLSEKERGAPEPLRSSGLAAPSVAVPASHHVAAAPQINTASPARYAPRKVSRSPPPANLALSPRKQVANSTPVSNFSGVLEENAELRKELELAEEDFESMMKERTKLIQNLKRLKRVITDQEETLEEKSADTRRLGEDLANLRDEKSKLQKQLRETNARGKDALDALRRKLSSQIEKLEIDFEATKGEEDRLRYENASIKEALAQGREEDMLTADGAREQASRAQAAYETEVAAHRETRESLKAQQEVVDAEASSTAKAIAAAQRKADEALAAASVAKEAQRSAESRLTRLASARDAALARVEDLTRELAPYADVGDGNSPGYVEIESLQQTVAELENALEAKNVELTRLEGDVENMRSVINQRNDYSVPRSPGAVVGAGGEFPNGREVEQKLRLMADSALRKQAQVEVLRSENKALQYQLDTERKRTREAQAMAAVTTSSRHNLRGGFRGILEGGDVERGDRAYGAREGPLARFRAPRSWPPILVKGLGEFDRFAALALAFLRREPLLRMAIVVYIVGVHVLLYSLLHYHSEQAMNDPSSTIQAHPRLPFAQQ